MSNAPPPAAPPAGGTPGGLSVARPQNRTKRVGNYILGRKLGSGSFSKVRSATNQLTGDKVAIKIISKQFVVENKLLVMLRKEISVLKRLDNPFVVKLLDVLHSKTKIFLVMELVSDGDLFEAIVVATRFDERRARRFFQQLLCGVRYCHAQGVVHRDLKPENLLVQSNCPEDGQSRLKITDFGLASLDERDARTMCFTTCGTPHYVAPEVVTQTGGYDGTKSDVWSCGVILFVMLAGRLPFDDPQVPNLFKKIANAEYVIPDHFTPETREFLAQILQPDPTRRLTVDQIYQHPWFLRDLPASCAGPVAARLAEPSDEELRSALLEVRVGSQPNTPMATSRNADDVPGLSLGDEIDGITPESSPRNLEAPAAGGQQLSPRKVQAGGSPTLSPRAPPASSPQSPRTTPKTTATTAAKAAPKKK
eukprot:gnl/Spiro4/8775_TR4610_c0_g1_i1.p1 gnl/Spiro4/8775_TR4610_c0_g1~~gnl/Spiro4/8775_TR4610_c0_g1_i1.p1  ORF type:complete len:437 (+),score=69.58 gnl/Spiro4/8775_TR4610_c0_g1_i1:47-1312(+)